MVTVTWSTFAHSENRVTFQKPAHNTRLLSRKRAEGWTEGGKDQGGKEWQERRWMSDRSPAGTACARRTQGWFHPGTGPWRGPAVLGPSAPAHYFMRFDVLSSPHGACPLQLLRQSYSSPHILLCAMLPGPLSCLCYLILWQLLDLLLKRHFPEGGELFSFSSLCSCCLPYICGTETPFDSHQMNSPVPTVT